MQKSVAGMIGVTEDVKSIKMGSECSPWLAMLRREVAAEWRSELRI